MLFNTCESCWCYMGHLTASKYKVYAAARKTLDRRFVIDLYISAKVRCYI